MKILSFDPGKSVKSFAYALLVEGSVVRFGTVKTLEDLNACFLDYAASFRKRMADLVFESGLGPDDLIVIERFSDRGGASKGTTGELINIMIGLLATVAVEAHVPLVLVMPSTWKNWLAKTYSTGKSTAKRPTLVPNMWLHLRERFPIQCWPKDRAKRMIIHEADACGIALWAWEKSTGRTGSLTPLIDNCVVKDTV